MFEAPNFEENKSFENKVAELLEGMCPDVIVVITGAAKEDKKTKHGYRSGSLLDEDNNSGLPTGGRDRVLAGAEIAKLFPKSKVFTLSGHIDEGNSESPTYAKLISLELQELNVSGDRIIELPSSVDTIGGTADAIIKISELGIKNAVFVTTGYHIPRCEIILEKLVSLVPDSKKKAVQEALERIDRINAKIKFISSDSILLAKSPDHFGGMFEAFYNHPGYKEREGMENFGIERIKNGQYIPR